MFDTHEPKLVKLKKPTFSMKTAWQSFNLTTKIALVFTVLAFFAIPATVLSLNTIRNNETKAAGLVLGSASFPDPVVSWTKEPQYRIDLCLNTTDRSSNLCNRDIYVNNNHSYTTQALNNYRYYWYVRILNNSGQWVDYQNGNWFNACFNTSGSPTNLCDYTITWRQPMWSVQATQTGNLNNACDGTTGQYCDSTREVAYPGKQVQFVDLPANKLIDVYVHVKDTSILYTTLTRVATGNVDVTSAPILSVPKYAETAVTTNNTPFAWSAVPGASYYAIWVSTGSNLVNTGFWYKNIPSNACNTSSCLATWNNIAWTTRNGTTGTYPPPPASLEKGKTYYWSVWACSSSTCPLVGLSTTSFFTTESPAVVPSVAGLVDSDSQSTVPPGTWGNTHKFEWTGANATRFVVDVSTDQNFSNSWANKVLDVVSANALTTYSLTGTGGWGNVGSSNWAQNGNLVLQENVTYYWRVYAWNSSAARHSATPNPKVNKPPTSTVTGKPPTPTLILPDTDTMSSVPPGVWGSTHVFSWTASSATLFAVDVSSDSTFTNGWVNKVMYTTAAATSTQYTVTGSGGWANQGNANYTSNGNLALQENTTYYWRVYAYNSAGGIHSSQPWPKVTKPPTGTTTKPPQPSQMITNVESFICGTLGVRYGNALTFRWSGSNATQYAVDISESSNFSGFANKVVSGSTFTVTGDTTGGSWTDRFNATALTSGGVLSLLPGKAYYWRVWASNSGGTTYDVNYEGGRPLVFNLPVCPGSLKPTLTSPPATGASPQPVFSFTPSSASYYGIAVSDNQTDLVNFRRLWRSSITLGQCGPLGCIRNWVDNAWSSYGDIGPKPYSLTPGKTYYWYVWPCTSSACPLDSRVIASFTIAGTPNNTPAKTLQVSFSNPGYPNFTWTPASTNEGTIEKHRVLIKQGRNGSNFGVGDYWITEIPALACYGKPTCSASLSDSWTWVPGPSKVANPNNPPKPLFLGDWNWIVIACKNAGCDVFNIIVSDVATFKVTSHSAGVAADLRYDFVQGNCNNGLVSTNIVWQSGYLLAGAINSPFQVVDYSVYNNNFLANTFQGKTITGFLQNQPYGTFLDLAPKTTYYIRVTTNRDGYYYPSTTKIITTKDCPPPIGGSDQNLDGSWSSLSQLIYGLTLDASGNPLPDPKVPGKPLYKVMWDTASEEAGTLFASGDDLNWRRKGLCSVGANGEIGVFQFMSTTWRGTNEYKAGADSGSGTRSYFMQPIGTHNGCWKIGGRDSNRSDPLISPVNGVWYDYETTFGLNIDGDAWNPYAQVRAAVKIFKAGGHCNWGGFKRVYPGYC